jgi:hypothetical protein
VSGTECQRLSASSASAGLAQLIDGFRLASGMARMSQPFKLYDEQWAAGAGPPPAEPPTWPWSSAAIKARLAEAPALLENCGRRQASASVG